MLSAFEPQVRALTQAMEVANVVDQRRVVLIGCEIKRSDGEQGGRARHALVDANQYPCKALALILESITHCQRVHGQIRQITSKSLQKRGDETPLGTHSAGHHTETLLSACFRTTNAPSCPPIVSGLIVHFKKNGVRSFTAVGSLAKPVQRQSTLRPDI